MAYRKYGRRAYNTGRRYAHNFRAKGYRYANSVNRGNAIKVRAGNEWLLGVALGFTNMDNQVPSEVKLGGATMPVGGKIGGKVKAGFQGMIFGNLVQHLIGFRTGGSDGQTGNDGTL